LALSFSLRLQPELDQAADGFGARYVVLFRGQDLWLSELGDGAYEASFVASVAGVYVIRIHTEGRTLRGFRFTREAVRTAAVWRGGDNPPPTKHDDGWCGVLRCLLEANAVDLELLKRLGIRPDRLLKCCDEEERIPLKKR
jgi:hypothetical protein